ncbi:MAG: [protein-PII] uridylyltransferase family protein [Thermoleophilia bacterium]
MASPLGQDPSSFLRQALGDLAGQHAAGAGGRELARRRADVVDLALISLFRQAEHRASAGPYREAGLAVVALGGYGRRELCPFSDIDLMLLYRPDEEPRVGMVAETLFYPLWDAGLDLGHGARTVAECLEVAEENLELLTSFFQARLLVGDQDLFRQLGTRLRQAVGRDGGEGFLEAARIARAARHAAFGDTHVLLEPHLKEGRGGLRDVHEALWLAFALRGVVGYDGLASTEWLSSNALAELERATDVLLRARTSLHYAAGRKVDRAYYDYQADLAGSFRAPGEQTPADRVMAQISSAAETVAVLVGGVWEAVADTALSRDTRAGVPAERVAERGAALLSLLRGGYASLAELERLSHQGVLSSWIPGWEAIRFLGQRESFHTYTVDGHSLRCVAAAAESAALSELDELAGTLAESVRGAPESDALLLACLLHDLGKGLDGADHSQAGASHANRVVAGLGLPVETQELVSFLILNHLLLADTASRRDIDDPALLGRLAATIGSRGRLELLYVLTVADSSATGRAVWTPWTAALVRELFFKLEAAFRVDEEPRHATRIREPGVSATSRDVPRGADSAARPSPVLAMVVPAGPEEGDIEVRVVAGLLPGVQEVTLVSRPLVGLLAKVSGVLAYHGITILSAQVQPAADGLVERSFRVSDYFEEEIPEERWHVVGSDLARAFEGRIALDHRLAEKAARYPSQASPDRQAEERVVVENTASDVLTVIEVHATDRIGLLYSLARTLDDLLLDVRLAKVSTMKDRAVDVFYVAGGRGEKLVDPEHLREVEKALLFALSRGGGGARPERVSS